MATPGTILHRRAVSSVVFATVVAVGLAGCGHHSSGQARLTVNGQSELTPAHGGARPAHSGDLLHNGDRVQVNVGEAAISLAEGGLLQLRTGAQVTMGKTPQLASGAVLIQPAGAAIRVAAQRATLDVPSGGVAQLSVGSVAASVTAKVYLATSQLDIVGNPLAPISAPRQINLGPETRLPVTAAPLQYQDSDPWDHYYLASAATISTELGAAVTGFNGQLASNQGKDATFYEQLLPALNSRPDFVAAFDGAQQALSVGKVPARPGDYLIASVIALRATQGALGTRLSDELAFSAQGANWGFVAYDQGVTDLTGVLNDVLAGIGRAALPITGAPSSQIAIGPAVTTTTRPPARPPRPPAPTTTVPPPRSPRPPSPATPTTTTTAPAVLQLPVPLLPGALGTLLNPLLDPLIQALNNILAGRH